MSEREDVEADLELASIIRRAALIQPLGPNSRAVHDAGGAVMLTPAEAEAASRAVLASSWLAAHDEAVRVSERVRLAGEVAGTRFRIETACDGYANLTIDDIPGDVFTEDDYMAGAADAANAIRTALAPSPGVLLRRKHERASEGAAWEVSADGRGRRSGRFDPDARARVVLRPDLGSRGALVDGSAGWLDLRPDLGTVPDGWRG